MATHSSILAWRIPRTKEPGGLQSMGSQGVEHDWATNTQCFLGLFWMCVLLTVCVCSFDVPLYMAASMCLNSLRVSH